MQAAIGVHIGPVRAFFLELLATVFTPSDGYGRHLSTALS